MSLCMKGGYGRGREVYTLVYHGKAVRICKYLKKQRIEKTK